MRRILILLVAFVASLSSSASAQNAPAAPPLTTLSVFLDCPNVFCDLDYIQTEITAVSWLRDRVGSDVHVLVSGEDTGAGGRTFTMNFIGLRSYAGLADTLKFSLPPGFTDEDRRKGLAQNLKVGLVRYVARTPQGARLTVSFGAAATENQQATRKKDPWNAWVFDINGGTYFNGEATFKSRDWNFGLGANRVTKAWKTQLSISKGESRSDNKIDDTTSFAYFQRNFGASFLESKSLGEHWSAGLRASVSGSTYDNFKQTIRITPAIEYNFFPYSQSTRRQVRIEYNIGVSNFAYHDSTTEDKLKETMPIHRLSISTSATEPWGSIEFGVNNTHYLTDRTWYRISAFGYGNLRLAKGFRINFYSNYQSIHDQFFLSKKDFTPQEILTRQYQRGTTFRYFGNVYLSYTFGSIFSSVVNPRFGGNND